MKQIKNIFLEGESPTLSEFDNFRSVGKLFQTIGVRQDNFFDQNTCFLKAVLVSKPKISYLLDFDQIVYIYHKNIEDKIKSVKTKVLIKSFRNRYPVNFFKVFHSNVTSVI